MSRPSEESKFSRLTDKFSSLSVCLPVEDLERFYRAYIPSLADSSLSAPLVTELQSLMNQLDVKGRRHRPPLLPLQPPQPPQTSQPLSKSLISGMVLAEMGVSINQPRRRMTLGSREQTIMIVPVLYNSSSMPARELYGILISWISWIEWIIIIVS